MWHCWSTAYQDGQCSYGLELHLLKMVLLCGDCRTWSTVSWCYYIEWGQHFFILLFFFCFTLIPQKVRNVGFILARNILCTAKGEWDTACRRQFVVYGCYRDRKQLNGKFSRNELEFLLSLSVHSISFLCPV